ncbi:MAG: hypothetical protein K9G61_03515 [Bacteroidales bacterium]|nr:hypothetical protein [Bacteroidales bacterium]
MKKLFFLSVVFLLGMSRLSAQGAWDVLVTWDIMPTSTCQFMDLPNDRFVVFITIYDEANNVTVVNNAYNIEPNDANESTFDVQSAVQSHCDDPSLTYIPSYIIYTSVRMVHIPNQYVYCYERSTQSPYNCTQFSNGIQLDLIEFN